MFNKPLLKYGIPGIAWLVMYHQALINMVSVWNQSNTYEHCYLIIPICLWLIWQDKEKLKSIPLSTAYLPACLLIFPCALWIVGRAANIALFEHLAAVISLQLIIWAIIGNRLAKACAFPIIYLIFCAPFGQELIPYLQEITTDICVILLRFFDVPVFREGMYLTVPKGQFEIAEACSGIRFLIASLALGTLFAHVFFRTRWKFWLFVAFSFVFPVIANGLRALTTILIGNFISMDYASGIDHLIYGWLFFSLVTLCNFLLAYFARDNDPDVTLIPQSIDHHHNIPVRNTVRQTVGTTTLIVVISAIFLLWNHLIFRHHPSSISQPMTLPSRFSTIQHSNWGISFPQSDQTVLARSPDGQTEFFSAQYHLQHHHGEIISNKNTFYDKERWTINGEKSITSHHRNATELSIVNNRGHLRRIIYWYEINGHILRNPVKVKLIELYNTLLGRAVNAQVSAVSSTTLNADELQLQFSSMAHVTHQRNKG